MSSEGENVIHNQKNCFIKLDTKAVEVHQETSPLFEKLFEELVDNQALRKKIFTTDINKIFDGQMSSHRPILVNKSLGGYKNPLDEVSGTFLSDLAFPLSIVENKEIVDAFIENEVFVQDNMVLLRCGCRNFIIGRVNNKKGKARCTFCGRKITNFHHLFYIRRPVYNILKNRGRIIEYFLFHVLKNAIQKSNTSKGVEIYVNPYIYKKFGKIELNLRKLLPNTPKPKETQEIDLVITKEGSVPIIILSSINPTTPQEKNQFNMVNEYGFKSIFVTTKKDKALEGYQEVIKKYNNSVLVPEIYLKKNLQKLENIVKEFLK